MTVYTLYKKTHNQTGLKYLGYTKKDDPYSYTGSGHHWKRHINKHGYDVTTEVLLESVNIEDIKRVGMYYSHLWQVVESNEWANLKPESASGGDMGPMAREKVSAKMKGRPKSEEWKIQHSKTMIGKKHSAEAKANHSKAMTGKNNGMYGRKHTAESISKMSSAPKSTKGKTYEEIYGVEKAAELKKLRSEHFKTLSASKRLKS